jgi:hypothetical protein
VAARWHGHPSAAQLTAALQRLMCHVAPTLEAHHA